MPFAPNTRSRSWMVTIQVANMENAGLTKEEYENAELLANFMKFIHIWLTMRRRKEIEWNSY